MGSVGGGCSGVDFSECVAGLRLVGCFGRGGHFWVWGSGLLGLHVWCW